MRAAIRTVEEELADADQPTAGWGWTLTYLEGSPLVDLDDGTRVRMAGADVALVTSVELDQVDPDEDEPDDEADLDDDDDEDLLDALEDDDEDDDDRADDDRAEAAAV